MHLKTHRLYFSGATVSRKRCLPFCLYIFLAANESTLYAVSSDCGPSLQLCPTHCVHTHCVHTFEVYLGVPVYLYLASLDLCTSVHVDWKLKLLCIVVTHIFIGVILHACLSCVPSNCTFLPWLREQLSNCVCFCILFSLLLSHVNL